MGSYHALCAHFQTKILLPLAVIMIIQCSLLCSMFLCSMELSPDLAPSFQLYIFLQICSKDTSFPVPVAFSSWHCDRCVRVCVCVCERERETERVCVHVCKFLWIHRWTPPPLSVYLVLRANDKVRRFTNIHLHYITLKLLRSCRRPACQTLSNASLKSMKLWNKTRWFCRCFFMVTRLLKLYTPAWSKTCLFFCQQFFSLCLESAEYNSERDVARLSD